MTLSKDDFRNCGWEKTVANALSDPSVQGYYALDRAFRGVANNAMESSESKKEKIFSLLARACLLVLAPANSAEPYKPFMTWEDGSRSALPQDFQPDEVNFFSQIAEEIKEPLLCARVADVVWLTLKPKDVKYALLAIENYMQFPVSPEFWMRDSQNGWSRAVQLCRILKTTGKKHLQKIENKLFSDLVCAAGQGNYLALQMSEFCFEHKLCQEQQPEIAKKIENLANGYAVADDWRNARSCFEHASVIFKNLEDIAMFAKLTVEVVQLLEKEAEMQPTVATDFYQQAIQKCRSIPNSHRAKHGVEKYLVKLRRKLEDANQKLIGTMRTVRSSPFDISIQMKAARNSVKGKKLGEAFVDFALLCGVEEKEIRKLALELIEKYPLQSMVPASHYSPSGRKVASRPGLGQSGNDEKVVFAKMLEFYARHINLVTQARILPALEVLCKEHPLNEHAFYSMVKESPIVPQGRALSVAKALCAGYNYDFIVALHILVPQVENMVRILLQQQGAVTATLEDGGVENEIGLSALMRLPEVQKVFGEDLVFEIRSLFCEPVGPNLRNLLAHGLVDDDYSCSAYSIYAWWFTLRLVYNDYLRAKIAKNRR